MTYKYAFDHRQIGDIWFQKLTYELLQRGLVRLRDRLQEWNEREAEAPYQDEVRDLTRMIEWNAERLAGVATEDPVLYVNAVSVGSVRYLKAGVMLQVLEAEEALQRENANLPSGVVATRRRTIAQMKELSQLGMFADLEPADCLWEIAPSAPVRTPGVRPEGQPHRWDLFICHATEDKDSFVRQLAERLQVEQARVWYDDFVLRLGDSLRRSIERGLSSSRYGVVVLSPRFFAKEWPQRELDGMAALEVDGRKIILPVWHEVELQDVRRYSPILADRVAIRSNQGMDTVVREILGILRAQGETLG